MNSLEGEVWVPVKSFTTDYTGLYMVSNLGRCYNLKTKRFVGTWRKNGYFRVCLSKNCKHETMQIGRLMLISFNVPIPNHLNDLDKRWLQASHIDENKANNCLSNFCWESPKENNSRPLRRKRDSDSKMGKYIGKNHPNSRPILQYTKTGQFIKQWDSLMDVERELGIKNSNISKCCMGRLNHTGGYLWRYKI